MFPCPNFRKWDSAIICEIKIVVKQREGFWRLFFYFPKETTLKIPESPKGSHIPLVWLTAFANKPLFSPFLGSGFGTQQHKAPPKKSLKTSLQNF